MDIVNPDFYVSWPDHVDIVARIEWTIPSTHDVLFSGLLEQDATAYFYAIVSLQKRQWITHYIGKVYAQRSSQRHRGADHIARLNELKKSYPNQVFHLTLGTPEFIDARGKPDEATIDQIEGLLIYSNWSDAMVNRQKIESFACSRQIVIENVGFDQHLWKRAAYGVVASNH
ncbi:hypothetical protein [Massilia niabensis]|uniref:GIY-YIG nuclease family protein n=1 Tax=Massilia niabensis TaxID=544910 RepID=A0ABW0L3I4_9BURK